MCGVEVPEKMLKAGDLVNYEQYIHADIKRGTKAMLVDESGKNCVKLENWLIVAL